MSIRASIPFALLLGLSAAAAGADGPPSAASYSPYAGEPVRTHVHWGDLHLHTSYSIDANSFGNRLLTPEDAYRFARGETIQAQNGMQVRLGRPLDFLMVSDHAEFLGLMAKIDREDPLLMQSEILRRWRSMRSQGRYIEVLREWAPYIQGGVREQLLPEAFSHSVWQEYAQTADRFNDPGRFTTFIGYEWTSMPDGDNLHRNVLFRDAAPTATRALPFSAVDSPRPEDLWKFLDDYETRLGGHAIDIPHNSNMSGGLMFRPLDSHGKAITREYARTRARWEPLVEATQIKGDSESHPFLSPNDEFASYGDWDWSNLGGSKKHESGWFAGEYVREALKTGLALGSRLGENPFKFGLVGSTDSHTGLSTAEEDNFWGKTSDREPSADRYLKTWMSAGSGGLHEHQLTLRELTAGMAAVWAPDNTREALFEAMKRRETYATTGPRMVVRFFGGWRFSAQDAVNPDPARIGNRKGVPMGGDLTQAPAGKAPSFLIHVARDPQGANLDRAQVVKGWLDADGAVHEQIYDVAVSGGRAIDADGRARTAVGNTVDVKNASYTNDIGAPELAVAWTDPDFDPARPAFYYLRVLEIPTPRWPAYDAVRFGFELPAEVDAVEQDRAYTSPIWYTPAN
ncbi:MAG: DUF3604 domain-containing protein [Gammaproteobacteria bacterium]